MKVKKIFLLMVFIFSLVLTNLFYSHSKPPLSEYKNTHNIVILAESNHSSQDIISFDLTSIDTNNFIVDYYKDMISLFIETVLAVSAVYLIKEKFFRYRKERGLTGIILWDRKRVLRN